MIKILDAMYKSGGLTMHYKKHCSPGGVALADFENLIGMVKNNNMVFYTGYMYYYNPYIVELKEQIKMGSLEI